MFKKNELDFLFGFFTGIGVVQLINLFWQGFNYLFPTASYELSFLLETLVVVLVAYYFWKKADYGKSFSNGYLTAVGLSVVAYILLII